MNDPQSPSIRRLFESLRDAAEPDDRDVEAAWSRFRARRDAPPRPNYVLRIGAAVCAAAAGLAFAWAWPANDRLERREPARLSAQEHEVESKVEEYDAAPSRAPTVRALDPIEPPPDSTAAAPKREPPIESSHPATNTTSGRRPPNAAARRPLPPVSLAREIAVLERAETALHGGRLDEAQASLQEHRAQFPAGTLLRERAALELQLAARRAAAVSLSPNGSPRTDSSSP